MPASPIDRWALDPAVVHLNHGSFGACLRRSVDAAEAFRARLEASPMRFLVLEWQAELDRARAALAEAVAASAARLAFVPSATSGVAVALASTTLAAGDEILTTGHVYPACRNQLEELCTTRGVSLTVVDVPLPFDADRLVDDVARAITPRTRLALLDHVTSPTALVYPLARLVDVLARAGVEILVDGAHAPGQIELAIDDLLDRGVTWYVGTCHKWLCAPKATGFLVTSEPSAVRPLFRSNGATTSAWHPNPMHVALDWPGTHDPSAQLAVPAALDALASEGGSWPAMRARNHILARDLRTALGGSPLSADDGFGSMVAMRLQLPTGVPAKLLERQLLERGIEVPIVDLPGEPLLRVSAHLYNHVGEAELLASALHALGARVI